eukprot:COSAG06_NODE_1904_length_8097_cov_6.229932_2_plen_183_part_00
MCSHPAPGMSPPPCRNRPPTRGNRATRSPRTRHPRGRQPSRRCCTCREAARRCLRARRVSRRCSCPRPRSPRTRSGCCTPSSRGSRRSRRCGLPRKSRGASRHRSDGVAPLSSSGRTLSALLGTSSACSRRQCSAPGTRTAQSASHDMNRPGRHTQPRPVTAVQVATPSYHGLIDQQKDSSL